jgi:hypothetical protein
MSTTVLAASLLLENRERERSSDANNSLLYPNKQCVHIYIQGPVGGYKCERERGGLKRHPLE